MALLTGRNAHSVNMGGIAEVATAFPGQTAERPLSIAPLAEVLKLNGYSTAMFGKTTRIHALGTERHRDRSSHGRQVSGFERFYGTLSAEADLFAPVLTDNTTLSLSHGVALAGDGR